MSRSRFPLLVVAALVAVGGAAAVAGAQSSGDVSGHPEIEVLATGATFDPGTEADLSLTLSNAGYLRRGGPSEYENRVTTARGTVLRIDDSGVPIDVPEGPIAVGEVPRGTTSVGPVAVTVPENVTPGTYRVPVELSYAYTGHVEYGSVGGPTYDDFERTERRYVTIRIDDGARFAVVGTSAGAQVGDEASLSVTLANVGTEAARGARVALSSPSDELTFGSGSGASTAYVGRWPAGERRTVEYTVALREDAALRDYALDAEVRYDDADGIARTSEPLSVGLSPARAQSFALRGTEAALRVGEEGRFAGRLVNRGPAVARDPVVVFRAPGSGITAESREYALPDLAPGESAAFAFDVTVTEEASAGARQVNVTVRYRNGRGDERTGEGLVRRVAVGPARDRFVVEPVNRTVAAGSTTALRLRVTNNGDEPLRNVEAKAFARDPLDSGDDEALVPRLAPGESATITVGLSAADDALTKTYPLSLDFQYELPDGDTAVSRTYTVPVAVRRTGGGSGLPFALVGAGGLALVGGAVAWRRRVRGRAGGGTGDGGAAGDAGDAGDGARTGGSRDEGTDRDGTGGPRE
ncbi:MAG: COG1361 S-layer family protein [Haloferacaceae archaeon]